MLHQYDLTLDLEENEYHERIRSGQKILAELAYELYRQRRSLVLAYEGWDAAGKGGNISRLVNEIDPRLYRVFPISAPKDEDARHHYLWRFWRRLPHRGHIAIFDRTWYGRVLVERVEGFCSEAEWRRAYEEINDFERQLSDDGAIVFKFWLHISQDEQLNRFKEREQTPEKSWKITSDDWRNRDQWSSYEAAVNEMLSRTSTPNAPWTVIEANSKRYARVKAIETVIAGLKKVLYKEGAKS